MARAVILTQEWSDRHPTAKPNFSPSGPSPNWAPRESPLSSATLFVDRNSADFAVLDRTAGSQASRANAAVDAILAESDFSWAIGDLTGDFPSRCGMHPGRSRLESPLAYTAVAFRLG
jgi:hypothetical protein